MLVFQRNGSTNMDTRWKHNKHTLVCILLLAYPSQLLYVSTTSHFYKVRLPQEKYQWWFSLFLALLRLRNIGSSALCVVSLHGGD